MLGLPTSLPGADPDVGSWLVAVVLFVAGTAALLVAVRWDRNDHRAVVFWTAIGLASVCLAVNKQLDAQEYLVEGSAAALLDPIVDWLRGTALVVVVPLLAVVGAGLTMTGIWLTYGLSRFRLALVGIALLALMATLRAAAIVRLGPGSVRLDHDAVLPFEMTGALLLLVASARHLSLSRRVRA